MRTLALPFFLIVGTACGGSAPPPDAPVTDAPLTEEKVVGPPDVKWADLEPEQKGKYMKAVVMPRMKALFQEYDDKTFAEFTCATCHGKDAKDQGFKMPSADLFVLPSDEAGFAKLAEEKPGWLRFMGERVKPEMAKLLALPEFDPKNPQPGTMGCYNCHTHQ